jgi:hypothetical protein
LFNSEAWAGEQAKHTTGTLKMVPDQGESYVPRRPSNMLKVANEY